VAVATATFAVSPEARVSTPVVAVTSADEAVPAAVAQFTVTILPLSADSATTNIALPPSVVDTSLMAIEGGGSSSVIVPIP